jgi:cobyrinic acid a,c-diamide synthase
MPALLGIARSASPWMVDAFPNPIISENDNQEPVTIGVIKDTAFQFYYSENIEALTDRGAKVIPISALDDKTLPSVDALYIGGGFPETHAGQLAANEPFRRSLKEAAEAGLPIYAECGGFIYLGESLTIGDRRFPMVGALPVAFGMEKKPQGHGYTHLAIDRDNPFFPVGQVITGHEFHYCRILSCGNDETHTAFHVLKGTGMDGQRDGLCRKNVLAGFSHLHALGTPEWADAMIDRARQYRRTNLNQNTVYLMDRPGVFQNKQTG